VAPNYRDWPERKLNSPYDTQNPYVQYVEDISIYPFSLKPEMKLGVKDVMKFQRSVFDGTIYDMSEDPDWYIPSEDGKLKKSPLATPFPRKEMQKLLDITHRRNVARGGYGMICQLRSWLPDPVGGVYWVYQDNQKIGPYAPIYAGVTEINESYKTYNPNQFNNKSARWNYDFVDNLMYLKWQEAWKDVKPVRDSLEQATFEEMKKIDIRAAEAYEDNPDKAREIITNYSSQKMDELVNTYRNLRYELIMKYTNNKQGINF
jgi:dipeptidase